MLLAFGVTFELPVVTFFLARIGLVTHQMMLRYARYAVLVIFIVAAVLTPGPDVASQLLMAGPLLRALRPQHRRRLRVRRLRPPRLKPLAGGCRRWRGVKPFRAGSSSAP